jgi:protein-disulfide isomerase
VFTFRRLALLVFAASLASLGCHAQTAPSSAADKIVAGQPLPVSVQHRIEVLLRQKAELPPESTVAVGPAQPAEIPGFSTVAVTFSSDGKTSHPVNFLVSDDGKTVAQFIKYDISADPRTLVSSAGRPARGGPPTAPVTIVNFDDLECPFCARFHASIFPAITQRYGDKVRIVYEEFPLDNIHPWAMHAAVDVECMAAQSPTGYWNLVDYIHAHASDIGSDPAASGPAQPNKPQHSLDRADAQLDKLTRDQGTEQKVDEAKLNACIAKQDTSAIQASKQVGNTLNIDATPTFFINGAKYDGAVSLNFIFSQIDAALRAQNITPPPPYVGPATPATTAPTTGASAPAPSPSR